jgi:ligand-binding sensor domain-containing protein/signal transduction histidine kinase
VAGGRLNFTAAFALAILTGRDMLAAMSSRNLSARLWLMVGVSLCAAGRLVAEPADYLVDKWDTEDSLPSSTVTSIAQTPDGYLWVGTYNGLARFDGARFVTSDPVNQPELTQTRVQGLFLDANGTLWINTFRGGLTSYRNGVFKNELADQPQYDLHNTLVYSTTNSVVFVTQFGDVLWRNFSGPNADWKLVAPAAVARPIFHCVDAAGTLWFLTRDGHILQFMAGMFKELKDDGGLAGSHIYTLVADAHGQVWAGAENEIARWNGTQFEAMTPTNGAADVQPSLLFPTQAGALWVLDGDRLRKMEGRAWVTEATPWRGLLGPASGRAMGVHEDRAGGLWFNHYGNGLFHITPDGRYERITTQNGLPGDRVGAWFQSRDGGIWAGVDHGGLARLRDRRFHVIGPAEGLPARTALSVCGDTNGSVWIGTAGGGLCRWSDGKISRFAVGVSASANFIFSIAPRADGGVWLSASEGEDFYQLLDGRIQRVSWDVHGIKSILVDHQNRIWIGLKAGLAWWAGNNRQVFNVNSNGFMPAIRALAETPDGSIWAGADDGTIFHCSQEKLEAFHATDALAGQPIYSLHADASGTLWVGTFRGGLVRFANGKFSRITAKQGLPADVISQIQEDNHGRLWLGTHQGIFCVNKLALNACADGRAASVDYVAYGRHDGLPALECSDGYQPASWRGPDGKLWFATVRGVVWVNPDELTAQSAPPPVLVEEFGVDGELVPLDGGEIIVPPGHTQFDFRFTALSFDAGDRARFRYRLEGVDSGWVDAETLRTAHYGHLLPRTYRFQVIACNNEGVWNNVGATVQFTVEPYFYQTTSFFIFASALVIGGVSFGVRRAVTRKYRRKLAAMEKQHAIERDRARIAKDIHDDVGAGLTQITLLTELARRDPEQTTANLERITQSARKLTKAMDEIVWAVDPQHDTVAGLMDYISAYAEDYLLVADVRCRMDMPVELPLTRVDAELRYNLFLALKEVLNNIVKHAKATEVWLRLRLAPGRLTLEIEDNGQGLHSPASTASAERLSSGSGLGNLEKRLSAVGGRCEIHSPAGQGTRVELTVFLKNAASPVVAIGADETVN